MSKKPIAVCISDIHFNINNLKLSSVALQAAVAKANDLGVPLVIAGDLNDTKAIIRAEVANAIIPILEQCEYKPFALVGNHDMINEKGQEHGLNYLKPYAIVVDRPRVLPVSGSPLAMIPYYSNPKELEFYLGTTPSDALVIMHQGVKGGDMGDYFQDHSAIDVSLLDRFKAVISGHYHRHQTIGKLTYIGSPFTMTFGEAKDGPKGFLILNSDGSFERVILDLRRHVKMEVPADAVLSLNMDKALKEKSNDLLWVKVTGTPSELAKINKAEIGAILIGHSNFKLDKIPTASETVEMKPQAVSGEELFDGIIDSTSESQAQKKVLKALWREVAS